MLRFLYFVLLAIPLTLWHSARTVVAAYFFGDPQGQAQRIGRAWSAAVLRAGGFRLEADLSALTPGGHYLFMVNHQSNLDIPLLYVALKDFPIRFVAKKSLFALPVFGAAMRRAGHIPIDRENRRAGMKSLQDAAEAAKAGICPLIFPEGTRHHDPEPADLQDFKIGGMILALKCGLPVAPLLVTGTGRALPRGRMHAEPAVLRVKALPPMDPSAYTLKERERFRDDLRQTMSLAYRELPKD